MKHRTPDHSVRLVTLLLWLPAFVFLLPYGINTNNLCPALGLVPMSVSVVIAAVHLAGKMPYRPLNILLDLFNACFLLGILIPGWVTLAEGRTHGWRSYQTEAGIEMTGTYGIAPMMVNLLRRSPNRAQVTDANLSVIHTYLGLRELYYAYRSRNTAATCPHCHSSIAKRGGKGPYAAIGEYDPEEAAEEHSEDSKESFHSSHGQISLKGDEPTEVIASSSKEPRPSTDDETARLV
ncbi:hypothetical protein LTR53_004533 [Teratosphaeriaceae sp. CCFEE 6253]|nr:hypothetical protein LTR53_004533 [Teratosphaeriaceae sp. CCFEE 6253]